MSISKIILALLFGLLLFLSICWPLPTVLLDAPSSAQKLEPSICKVYAKHHEESLCISELWQSGHRILIPEALFSVNIF